MDRKVVITILLVMFVSGFFMGQRNSYKPLKVKDPVEVEVSIAEGTSPKKIGEILKEKKLIRNGRAFTKVVKRRDDELNLKAGDYIIMQGQELNRIIDQLVEGVDNRDVVKFTIPEGYEIRQIAEKLSREGIVDQEEFLSLTSDKANFEDEFEFLKELKDGQDLEGFLFPATYEVFVDESEEDIIKRMLKAFGKIYEEDLKGKIAATDLDLNEIVSLASIIEREAKIDDERPIMAGVFYNRIKDGMRLQSCATVQYVLGERKPRLSIADTQMESPYNTYVNNGLPPAPIAAPGKISLISAIEPADVDYLYFTLKDKEGNHEFTKTHAEHRKATDKYREFLKVEDS